MNTTGILNAVSWDSTPEEMRFLGACAEFFSPISRNSVSLFKLLDSGVDQEWFTDDLRSFLFAGFFEISPSIGDQRKIIKLQAVYDRAEELSGKRGWAREVLAKCAQETYDLDVDEFIDNSIPLWLKKLRRPRLIDKIKKVNEAILNLPAPDDHGLKIEKLLSDAIDTWSSPPDKEITKPAVFASAREFALTDRPVNAVIPSGLSSIDTVLGGGFSGPDSPEKGKLITIMARPGGGKTLLAINLAMRVATAGYQVPFWSLEMQDRQIAYRAMAAYDHDICRRQGFTVGGPLTYEMLRTHAIPATIRERLKSTDYSILEDNFPIFQGGLSTTVEAICHKLRVMKKKNDKTVLAIIDHIGLLRLSGSGTRAEQVGEVTRMLKVTAVELGIDIIQISQLNRGVEGRNDKMPTMSDARDSGSIEQDSDVMLGLLRPAYYDSQADNTLLQIGVLKNRQGETRIFDATVNLSSCVIHDRN